MVEASTNTGFKFVILFGKYVLAQVLHFSSRIFQISFKIMNFENLHHFELHKNIPKYLCFQLALILLEKT